MEFGLRTLGARSIIADPRSESKQKNLNLKAIHSSPFISEVGSNRLRKNIDKIDLLAVGGSTTNQQFINLEDTWPELLEKKFEEIGKNIDAVNAGKGGQSTIGHIWNFDNWFSKIKNFRTRYIIFYVGINDARENIYKNISVYDHGKKKQKIF